MRFVFGARDLAQWAALDIGAERARAELNRFRATIITWRSPRLRKVFVHHIHVIIIVRSTSSTMPLVQICRGLEPHTHFSAFA